MPQIENADEARNVSRLIQAGQITGTARDTAMQALRDFDTQSSGNTGEKPGFFSPDYPYNRADELKWMALRGAQDVIRPIGTIGQAVGEGALSTVSVPLDLLGHLANVGLEKLGINYRLPTNQTQNVHNVLSSPYINPQGTVEKIGSTAIRGATAGALTAGAAGAIAPVVGASGLGSTGQRIAAIMADRPLLQTVGGATGGASLEAANQLGGGPVAQTVAGMVGGAAPAVGGAGAAMMLRSLLRGGEQGRQTMAENIAAFNKAGTDATVGQAAQNRRTQAIESLLSKTPGGAGVMAKSAQQQAEGLGAGLEQQAAGLAPKSGAEQAGRAITRGVSGDQGFLDNFKSQSSALYNELDRYIPPDTPVPVANTQRILDKLTQPIKGATAISSRFINPRIASMKDDLATDAKNGMLPYEAVKQLRTKVGEELADAPLKGDVPLSQWKQLYGALSGDLEGAAQAAGPQATQAFNRATNYYRAGSGRIELLQNVLDRNGGPEAVFRAAMSGTKDGATTLRAVMQSLPDDGQQMLSATVLRRLGLAKAGVQNDLGDKFSTESLLTNWNLLSPEAKRALFDRFGPDFRANMDNLARVTDNLRSGSKVFVNPSGTGQVLGLASAASAFFGSLFSGHWAVASLVGTGVGGANLSARLMTNPRFVSWLATSTKAPTSAIPVLVQQLARTALTTNDRDLKAAAYSYQQQLNSSK